ncbi:MAG TPA: hypothetical protein VK892_15495 [Pyrinomonadaceae bacterium]|nr:hypothetical protein [Pyrinomonadaceae bacterium]
MSNLTSLDQLHSIMPLGAGDLIDRAVRFYRKNFWTFVWIAAPPILAGTLFSILWTMLGRELFSVGSTTDPDMLGFYYLFTWFGNMVIWMIEMVATFTVMGGASRNFVRHLLFGEPITFRETYKNVQKWFFGLLTASTIITLLLGVGGTTIFYLGLIFATILVMIAIAAFSFAPFIAIIVSVFLVLATGFGTLWLIFLIVSRFAYVPQVMLVEGQSVFSAIGRSASLASGNVKRLVALFVFTTVATYSALAILYIPLSWYAWANGVQFFSFVPDAIPAWYEISYQVISQVSLILLIPVWMIGLCLLYVDERVRHEGYDIELMAARRLGEIPAVPQTYINPLQPALSQQPLPKPPQKQKSSITTLGLK